MVLMAHLTTWELVNDIKSSLHRNSKFELTVNRQLYVW